MTPSLVAVAHGSRDARSAATVAELVGRVRERHPGLDVRLAFLDLSSPRLGTVLAGVGSAVVVPLLLGRAFHAKVDVPGVVAEAVAVRPRLDVSVTDVLGPDERLERAALHRLAAAGADTDDPELGVVLGAAGSAQATANAAVTDVADRWSRRYRWAGVEPAFACAASPTVPEAVDRLHAAGARRIAVASWFLAPGLLPDKVTRLARESGGALLAEPLGPDDGVADLIAERYEAALAGRPASPA